MTKALPLRGPRSVEGSWNPQHCAWTTADGRFKVVRRFARGQVPGAWLVYIMPNTLVEEYPRFSEARLRVSRLNRGELHPAQRSEDSAS